MQVYAALKTSCCLAPRESDADYPLVLVRLITGESLVVDRNFEIDHSPEAGYFLKHRRNGLVSRAFPTDAELRATLFNGDLEYLGYPTD